MYICICIWISNLKSEGKLERKDNSMRGNREEGDGSWVGVEIVFVKPSTQNNECKAIKIKKKRKYIKWSFRKGSAGKIILTN